MQALRYERWLENFPVLVFDIEPPAHTEAAVPQEAASLPDLWPLIQRFNRDPRFLAFSLSLSPWFIRSLPYIMLGAAGGAFGDCWTRAGRLLVEGAKLVIETSLFEQANEVRDLNRLVREKQGLISLGEKVVGLRALDRTCSGQWELVVGPARYSDFFYSNGADNLIRDALYARYGGLPDFSTRVASHTLGVAALLATADGYVIFAERNARRVGVNAGINVPISGGVEWNEQLLRKQGFMGVLLETVRREAALEMGLVDPSTYHCTLVGAVRELPRGGSPEFLFWLQTRLTLRQVIELVQANKHPEKFEAARFIAQSTDDLWQMLERPDAPQAMHHKALMTAVCARACFNR